MPRAPGSRLGRYVLERRLAAGGMGEAWLAQQEGIGGFHKRVVIKLLHPQLARDPQQAEAFLAEARMGARLNHAAIVQIFDVGQHETGPYLAMEFVDGLTLQKALQLCWARGRGIPLDIAVRACAAAAQGLAHAHGAGVIHRDISPDNIIIGRDGAVKVLDFGVAKLVDADLTRSGERGGKVAYMSPEQADGGIKIDARADLYALGVILYECIAGRRPFVGEMDVQIIRAIAQDAPTPLRSLNPACPPELAAIVMELLEKDRERREGDGSRLATRLLATLPPTTANPLGPFIEELQATLDAQPAGGGQSLSLESGAPAEWTAPMQRNDGESPAPLRRSGAALAVALAAATLAVIAGAIVAGLSRAPSMVAKPLPPTVARAHLVVRDQRLLDEPEPRAERASEENDRAIDDGTQGPPAEGEDLAGPETPSDVDAGAATTRVVSLIAPHNVVWTTSSGKRLASGTRKVRLDTGETTLVALDPWRGGRHTMRTTSRMDFFALPRGTVDVRVTGRADVARLGKENLGRPPLRPFSAAAGAYVLVVSVGDKSVRAPVRVKADATTVVELDMANAR